MNAGRARAKIDHGRGVFAGGAMAVIVIVGMPVIVRMIVIMGVMVLLGARMVVSMIVLMRMVMWTLMRMTVLRFDARLSLDVRSSAAADGTHHSTSNSFTRMSSPAATCT
jgi:hypothetical protein